MSGWSWQLQTPPPVPLPEGYKWVADESDWNLRRADDSLVGFVCGAFGSFEARVYDSRYVIHITEGTTDPLEACWTLAKKVL